MSKYWPLAKWLEQQKGEAVFVSFEGLERILGFVLPESGRKHGPFWSGTPVVSELKPIGWKAGFRTGRGVEFRRISADSSSARMPTIERVELPSPIAGPASHGPLLTLVGCVKTKRAGRHRARDLYTSALFQGRRSHAESAGAPWLILSAGYGLVDPDEEIDSYDVSLLDMSTPERRAWSANVLAALDERFGSLAGWTVEIHAGQEYRESGLRRGLIDRGAAVSVPLERLSLGEQISWYQQSNRTDRSIPEGIRPDTNSDLDTHGVAESQDEVARLITEDFMAGAFDLSARPGAPAVGWESMPEVVAVEQISRGGAPPAEARLFLTLVAAMDRAREADRLWAQATMLYEQYRWVFDPDEALRRSLHELRDVLAATGVSQRHGVDAAAWRLILESLVDERAPAAVRHAIVVGEGDARDLLVSVTGTTGAGQPWYPLLSGPKVSVMWVRMLASPGGATITNLADLPVAVDVQVRKVTEYLGVTDTGGLSLGTVRGEIQDAWRSKAVTTVGPPGLAGTGAVLDPAIWFYGKWGCSHCERVKRRVPIGRACACCRFPSTK